MIERIVSTRMPTRHGEFTLHAYKDPQDHATPLALVCGQITEIPTPLVRIHSECLTGDLFGSLRCDCGQQLESAMHAIQQEGCGILLYLRQEGRGIGLVNKLRAYNLQDKGLDTVEANQHLGFAADHRDYKAAIAILEDLQVSSIRLLTNNPNKLSGFNASSIQIVQRVPLEIHPGVENINYLRTKRDRLGHLLELGNKKE